VDWRPRKKTLNEELLEAGPREAEIKEAAAHQERQRARTGLVIFILLAGALFLPGLHLLVGLLPAWAAVVVGFLVVGHFFWIFVRSTRGRPSNAGRTLRGAFLLSLALAVAISALVAIGGFQPEDRALLGFVWPVVALLWVAYRLRTSRARLRAEKL
jgi:hypothetical protein